MPHDVGLDAGVWKVKSVKDGQPKALLGYLNVTRQDDNVRETYALHNGLSAPPRIDVAYLYELSNPFETDALFKDFVEKDASDPLYPGSYAVTGIDWERMPGSVALSPTSEPPRLAKDLGTLQVDEGTWIVNEIIDEMGTLKRGGRLGYITHFKIDGTRIERFGLAGTPQSDKLLDGSFMVRILSEAAVVNREDFDDWLQDKAVPPGVGRMEEPYKADEYTVQQYKQY